ncbi:hypothetical protein [Agrobacterium tumefaciens]|uniref:Uncharacterized protein n=1 Tax=Agrobacterium tumefaciens TaxID=358 RepID=A0AA44F985_AGRTU|nr:hypothetical protein [Agrobacterium tumefaciens]NTB86834.1 hypothetical protein [Agrobacterium tumefaciens]NTC21163.1 hypothetical protein [Agrobacterium tumefaciens]NTC30711.1 hypothetical protein [Agrobacterium tumefaciens]
MADNLETSIYLTFVTAEKTIKSNYAGTGQTRRRSTTITKVLAEIIVDRLSTNYTFTRRGTKVDKTELIEFVAMHLWAVPDDVAKASGSKLQDIKEQAAKAITHGLFLALDMEYIRSYESQDFLDPSSPRYINRAKA